MDGGYGAAAQSTGAGESQPATTGGRCLFAAEGAAARDGEPSHP